MIETLHLENAVQMFMQCCLSDIMIVAGSASRTSMCEEICTIFSSPSLPFPRGKMRHPELQPDVMIIGIFKCCLYIVPFSVVRMLNDETGKH